MSDPSKAIPGNGAEQKPLRLMENKSSEKNKQEQASACKIKYSAGCILVLAQVKRIKIFQAGVLFFHTAT